MQLQQVQAALASAKEEGARLGASLEAAKQATQETEQQVAALQAQAQVRFVARAQCERPRPR